MIVPYNRYRKKRYIVIAAYHLIWKCTMKRNPTDVNIVEKPFSDQSYLSDHMGMQIMQRDSNLAKYRLYTENSAFARHNEIDTDKNT